MTAAITTIDNSLPFQYIECSDTGPESGARCPHCGAEGRYIHHWAEFGKFHAAMAGCFAALTGKIKKSDVDKHIERLAVKQSRNKPLNGWDKTILKMLEYKAANASDEGKVSWADGKIFQAARDAKTYSFKQFGR